MARAQLSEADTKRLLEDMLEIPPSSSAEFAARLRGVDKRAARELAVARLSQSDLVPGQRDVVAQVLGRLGLGASRQAVCEIALDSQRSFDARNCAIQAIVFSRDMEAIAMLRARLNPEEAQGLMESGFEVLLEATETSPAGADGVVDLLKGVSQVGDGASLLKILEKVRQKVGAPAVAVYRKSVGVAALAQLREPMLAAIVEERAPEAEGVLRRCLEGSKDDVARREFLAALMRLRTRDIADRPVERHEPGGYALVSTCDGQGGIVVMACFARPDRMFALADVCLRLSGDVRNGFFSARETEQSVRDLVLRLGGDGQLVRVSLAHGAHLITEAAERTGSMGSSIPDDLEEAVNRCATVSPPSPEPLPIPASDLTLSQTRALLERPGLSTSWFFDRGDLEAVGAWPAAEDERWMREATLKLDTPMYRDRLRAMACHMARWCAWNGEAEPAASFSALAAQLDGSFRQSLLLRVMLERSKRLGEGTITPKEAGMLPVGSAESRRIVREVFFAGVRRPTGRDLALLDLTEVAWEALGRVRNRLLGEQRPRDEQILAVARAIGGLILERGIRQRTPMKEIEDELTQGLARSFGIASSAARTLAEEVAERMVAFLGMCGSCPVACLGDLDLGVSDPFFAARHPNPVLRE
ncbi:MAG TPA: hypothetical protein VMK12_21615 [Anaeromyxobacteraceae bacterium]|nr:hypothetical protein [Anaeromyxobacteraceae bacterium]